VRQEKWNEYGRLKRASGRQNQNIRGKRDFSDGTKTRAAKPNWEFDEEK
jgi:hypothetical protein